MPLPSAEVLGVCYGLSEAALGIFKRSGSASQETDRSSLRVLWIVVLCCVAGAIVATRLLPQAGSTWLTRSYPLGVALFVVGLALRWYAIVYLGRFFTVDVAIAADHRVVDSGPYRYLRHPSYTGALLAFMRRIEVEETALRRALGESYAAYARRTKRLVPLFY